MPGDIIIRPVTINDIPQLLRIYTPYILDTAYTPVFEIPSLPDFEKQLIKTIAFYPFLVCLLNGEIVGYAYGHPYRPAAGHQWSAETSIYLSAEAQGTGIARSLYQALLALLAMQGFVNVFAGIILPNERSMAFHKKLQFMPAGIFRKGIYKKGHWHDVQWMQLTIGHHTKNPSLPKSFEEINTGYKADVEKILQPVS